MKRQVALDTETTGKSDDGTPGEHRIIEVGCVEIIDRKLTGRTLQLYVNPERPVDEEAFNVHGISNEFLADKPKFAQVADKLIDFIRGSELLIHNAKFDVGFMDKEWMLLGLDETTEDMATVVDTVSLAMKLCPGRQVNLDNLCNLFDVDRSARSLHGALLDAQILAEVYLAMTGGQSSLEFSEVAQAKGQGFVRPEGVVLPQLMVDEKSHASHVDMMIEIAFNKPFKTPEGQPPLSGCYWSDEYSAEYPVKGENEAKKEYKKRLNDAIDKMHKKILSEQQLNVLDEYLNEEKAAYKEWEDRVMGRNKKQE